MSSYKPTRYFKQINEITIGYRYWKYENNNWWALLRNNGNWIVIKDNAVPYKELVDCSKEETSKAVKEEQENYRNYNPWTNWKQ